MAMKVSDLQFDDGRPWRVETTTDALHILPNRKAVSQFINEYGDPEIEYDARYNVCRVPDFAAQIERYTAAKQIDCDRWGCE